jgi:rubrerythrin
MREVLELAIGFEKDSIVFYLGMKDLVPAAIGGVHLDTIIKEEMTHLSILGGRLAEVAA